MLERLTTLVKGRHGKDAKSGPSPTECHGSIYNAARNAFDLCETALTVIDTDRIVRVLAELHQLGTWLNAPQQDLVDIAAWRDKSASKSERLRQLPEEDVRFPSLSPVEVYISRGIISPVPMPIPRRASA